MKNPIFLVLFTFASALHADADIDKIKAMAQNDNKNIVPFPIIVARALNTTVEIDQEVKGADQQTTSVTRKVFTSRSLDTSNVAENSWEESIKRSVSADVGESIGSGGKGYSISGNASYSQNSIDTAKHHAVRTELSKDSDDLTSLEDSLTKFEATFGPDSGRISTAVSLQNLSRVEGFVENLRVTLKARSFETGAVHVLAAATLCHSDSNVIELNDAEQEVQGNNGNSGDQTVGNPEAAGSAKAAGKPAIPEGINCRIPILPQDPNAKDKEVPVTFVKINTGKIRSMLDDDVWIEVDSLTVGKGDGAIPAATAIAILEKSAYSFFIMRPGGYNDLFYYLVDGTISPKAALEDGLKGQIVFSENPLRIRDINQWQSDLSEWGPPKEFRKADLNTGMWVITSPTFNRSLSETGLPGHHFEIFYITKRDLLSTLDLPIKKGLLVGDAAVFQEINGFINTDAQCSLSTDPERRVIVGDKVKLSISVQERKLQQMAGDKYRLSDPKWHPLLIYFEKSPQNPQVFVTNPEPPKQVEARDLSKYGIGISLSRKVLPVPLADFVLKSGVTVTRNNGEVVVSFDITSDMMPDGKGEVCITTTPEIQQVEVGRKFTPYVPNGNIAVPPAPNGPMPPTLDDWQSEFPYGARPFILPRKTTGSLEITRIGRPIDAKEVAFRDSDADFYLSPQCLSMKREYLTFKPRYDQFAQCAAATDISGCLRVAFNASPPPIPVPAVLPPVQSPTPPTPEQKAQYVKQSVLQACSSRKALANFIRGCSADNTLADDAECEHLEALAP